MSWKLKSVNRKLETKIRNIQFMKSRQGFAFDLFKKKWAPPFPNTTFNVLFKGGGNFDFHAYQGLVQKGTGMLSLHMSS